MGDAAPQPPSDRDARAFLSTCVAGDLWLFVTHWPCVSCLAVLCQFCALCPRVHLKVAWDGFAAHTEPHAPPPNQDAEEACGRPSAGAGVQESSCNDMSLSSALGESGSAAGEETWRVGLLRSDGQSFYSSCRNISTADRCVLRSQTFY